MAFRTHARVSRKTFVFQSVVLTRQFGSESGARIGAADVLQRRMGNIPPSPGKIRQWIYLDISHLPEV